MIEDLKATARRTWEEIFPACDVDALADVIAVDSIDHAARPGEAQGLKAATQAMLWLDRVFSNQRWEIQQVIGEDDTVVVYCTHHGRQTGDLMGIQPTGREVAYDYVHVVRFQDGKIVEHWSVRDETTLTRQLGVIPIPRCLPRASPEHASGALMA